MKEIIQHPSIILIVGRRRYGKSALGYSILEGFHSEQPELKIFVVSLPKERHHLLPDWITPVDTVKRLPDNCVALIDEGALRYHAYMWGQKETVVMDKIISVSGHKNQTFIFITHTMRKFAVTLLLDIDTLLCKKPSLLHSKLERNEVRKIIERVSKEFSGLPEDEVKKNTYAVSDNFEGFIRNSLPSFWSEELSKSYAGVSLENIKQGNVNSKHMEKYVTYGEELVEEKEGKPEAVQGGFKIWCKKEDQRKVLGIVSKHSTIDGTLADESMGETAGKAHINFDLKEVILGTKRAPVFTGRYRLSSDRFDVEEAIKELEDKKIPHMVDIETGKPVFAGGEVADFFYPVSPDDIDLEIKPEEEEIKVEEKEEVEDKLEDFAKKIKL